MARERHAKLEETDELCFRQRIGAFHLERVLRGHDEERLLQHVRRPGNGYLLLLHRLEQRGLRSRRGAVDLVGQDDVREDRTRLEVERLPPCAVLLKDARSDDIGRHQVGGELDARVAQRNHPAERPHQKRLAEPRDPFEQHVSAGQQRRDDALYDFGLADDGLRDLAADLRHFRRECLDVPCDRLVGRRARRSCRCAHEDTFAVAAPFSWTLTASTLSG